MIIPFHCKSYANACKVAFYDDKTIPRKELPILLSEMERIHVVKSTENDLQ